MEHRVSLRPEDRRSKFSAVFARYFGVHGREILLGLLAIFVAGGIWYAVSVDMKVETPSEKKAKEERLIREVGSHVILPTSETPQLATVVDPAQYKNDPLLSQSLAGDKVLVFPTLKKAILYRPSLDRVVDMMGFELPVEAR